MESRVKEIKKASLTAIIGNAFLAILKVVVGLIAGSLAVVADGIDSMEDIITSVITLITANVLSRPPNKKYPYGYAKAETIATGLLALIIFAAGIQLAIISVQKIIKGTLAELPLKIAIYVTVISIIGKAFLSYHQFKIGNRVSSEMLRANAKNMQNDILISLSVLVGLVFTHLFKMPVIDSIAALVVSAWIIKVAVQIFLKTNVELMDGTKDNKIYNTIFRAIDSVEGVKNPHRVVVRNVGHKLKIGADIEVDGNMSLKEAHELSNKVEESIRSKIDHLFDVTIHVEPIGDKTIEKEYGISRNNL
ncbi:MAG: cation transporter [Bacteroidales bacterium]|nr:MAG: cation transporter [Bacteroidales bacterium]